MSNEKKANLYTTTEVSQMLGLSYSTINKRAKILGKKIEMGKFTYYSDDEVFAIRDYVADDKKIRESFTTWPNGEKRVVVSEYNEKLKCRIQQIRSHHNYLKGTGEWDNGVTRIPKGYVIHHIDGDYLNDDFSNLQLMSISEHRKYHDSISDSRRKNSSVAVSKAHLGLKHSDVTKQKMRDSQRKRRAAE